MKKYIAIAILTGWSLWAAADDEVQYSQLPQPVQKALDASKGTDPVKEIEKQVKDGKTVYEVELERSGFNPKLVIAEDGTILRDSRRSRSGVSSVDDADDRQTAATERTALPRRSSLQLSEVPQPVQNAIKQNAAGRKLVDIDKETWKNRTVYEVEYDQAGRNAQIYFAEDGSIVKDEAKGKRVGTSLFGLYLGTQLEDTPPAVRATILKEGSAQDIVDIDREEERDQPAYEVEYKRPGRNYELVIAQDGRILRDSRRTEAVGGTVESDTRTGTGRATDVEEDRDYEDRLL